MKMKVRELVELIDFAYLDGRASVGSSCSPAGSGDNETRLPQSLSVHSADLSLDELEDIVSKYTLASGFGELSEFEATVLAKVRNIAVAKYEIERPPAE